MKPLLKKLADKQGVILQVALGAIMVFFICFLVVVYFVAKAANPIILDEKGRPLHSEQTSAPRSY